MRRNPITVTSVPWWKMYLARIFGKKRLNYDTGWKTTLYEWRGVKYIWRVDYK